MSPDPQYSMLSHYQFEFMIYVALATKIQNYKKKVFMIYVTLATKLQKKVFMIYVIHVCLDVALMEGEPVPLCDFQKYPPTGAAYS